MDQKEYDRRYKKFPWWSNFLLTFVLFYPFITFSFGIGILFVWWIHVIAFGVAVFGIWFWDPITEGFRKFVDGFLH